MGHAGDVRFRKHTERPALSRRDSDTPRPPQDLEDHAEAEPANRNHTGDLWYREHDEQPALPRRVSQAPEPEDHAEAAPTRRGNAFI